jgi:hypothetical protein
MNKKFLDITDYLEGKPHTDLPSLLEQHNFDAVLVLNPREVTFEIECNTQLEKFNHLCNLIPRLKELEFYAIGNGSSAFRNKSIDVGYFPQWCLNWQFEYEEWASERFDKVLADKWTPSTKGLFLIGKARWANRQALIDAMFRNNLFDTDTMLWSYFPPGKGVRLDDDLNEVYNQCKKDFAFTPHDLLGIAKTLDDLDYDLTQFVPVEPGDQTGLYFNGYPYKPAIFEQTGFSIIGESYYENNQRSSDMGYLLSEKYWKAIRNKHPVLLNAPLGAYQYLNQLGLETFEDDFGLENPDVMCSLDPNHSSWDHEKFVAEFGKAVRTFRDNVEKNKDAINEKVMHNYNQAEILYQQQLSELESFSGTVYWRDRIHDMQDMLESFNYPYFGFKEVK